MLATIALMLGAFGVSAAQGAVAFRAASCENFAIAFWPPYSMTIDKPTGTLAGYLMVATIRTSGWYSNNAGPSGWTELQTDGSNTVTYYKVAGAAEPGSYTFTGPSGGGNMAGGIVSLSGVDTSDPFASQQQTTSGTAAAVTLPGGTADDAGSMRLSMVTSSAGLTSTWAGMTEACDQRSGSISASMAWEAVGSGALASRTVTRSGSGANVAQTFVVRPVGACGGGTLGLALPPAVSFPTTVLNGIDQTKDTTVRATITDLRTTATGWNLSATSTRFTNGTSFLANDATTIESADPAAAAGNCSMPTSSIGYPVTLPAGATAPTATRLFNAASGTGRGPLTVDLGLRLKVPARARVGTYASVWTLTLAAGP